DMVPREESRFYQYQDSQFMSDEDLILEAACGTHLPNLSIYVAYPNDEIYSDIFHSLDDEEVQSKMLRELRDFVIPVLQKRFDIIIIDTPPQDSPITWATTMAA
ncbi:ParA family protein, partial [Vibrio anguillarum]